MFLFARCYVRTEQETNGLEKDCSSKKRRNSIIHLFLLPWSESRDQMKMRQRNLLTLKVKLFVCYPLQTTKTLTDINDDTADIHLLTTVHILFNINFTNAYINRFN